MNKSKALLISGLLVLLALAGWNWRQVAAADRPVKMHIFYSSDALGYTEPCG